MAIVAKCRFPGTTRTYDYLSDEPVKPGDRAYVDARGRKAEVEVVEVTDNSPFGIHRLKKLLAVLPPKEPEQGSMFEDKKSISGGDPF